MKAKKTGEWPKDCVYDVLNMKKETQQTFRSMFILFGSATTIKELDTQVPTLPTTYRQYLLESGLVDKIVTDYDGVLDDENVYLLIV